MNLTGCKSQSKVSYARSNQGANNEWRVSTEASYLMMGVAGWATSSSSRACRRKSFMQTETRTMMN
jgi:hypothetical protein